MRALVLLGVALVAPGCTRTPGDAHDAGALPSQPSVARETPRPVPIEAGPPRRRDFTCRAMVVQGSPTIARDGGAKPLAMDERANGWVTLGTADSLTVTFPRTGRELTFVGPGLVLPCADGEQAWVARGRFQGGRGSGETPGANQWVVTPFGIVRYGSATVEVAIDTEGMQASLKGGSASVFVAASGSAPSQVGGGAESGDWETLLVGKPRVVKGAPLTSAGAAAAAARCAKVTSETGQLEQALTAPDAAASPEFGLRAMHANDAHTLMVAACAVAKLRADPALTKAP